MLPYYNPRYGNPSSLHKNGRSAKQILEKSRGEIARVLHTLPGEIIFTADGVSGPAIIDLSARVGELLPASTFLKIDFKPEIELAELEKKLQTDFHGARNKLFKNYLAGLLPPKLAPVINKLAGIDALKQVSDFSKTERQALARALKELALEVKELKGFSKAMITAGGVDVKEVDPRTMRSKLYENLFLPHFLHSFYWLKYYAS